MGKLAKDLHILLRLQYYSILYCVLGYGRWPHLYTTCPCFKTCLIHITLICIRLVKDAASARYLVTPTPCCETSFSNSPTPSLPFVTKHVQNEMEEYSDSYMRMRLLAAQFSSCASTAAYPTVSENVRSLRLFNPQAWSEQMNL